MQEVGREGSRRGSRLRSWVKVLRLKFYPMSWVAYAIGAVLAGQTGTLAAPVFWLGLGFLFWLEAATVLSNEYYDYESDRRNALAGPFSGGSRVIVNGELDFRDVAAGTMVALLLAAAFALGTLLSLRGSVLQAGVLMSLLIVLALGYTIPPLKLAWRGLGELDVGVTDSIGVLLCGYVFLGGDWRDPLPWLLSLPLGLAFLPSITLSGVPDYEADRQAGKKTLAVRFGIRAAALIAGVSALAAALAASALQLSGAAAFYGPMIHLSLLHALLLAWMLKARLAKQREACRIDTLMIVSLTFVLWFGLLPLIGVGPL